MVLTLGRLRTAVLAGTDAGRRAGPYFAVCRLPRQDTWTSPVGQARFRFIGQPPCVIVTRCFLLRGWLGLQPFDLDATAEGVNLAVQLRRPLPEGLWPAIAPPEAVLEIWLGPPGDLGRLCGRETSGSKAALFKLANMNPSYPLYARSCSRLRHDRASRSHRYQRRLAVSGDMKIS